MKCQKVCLWKFSDNHFFSKEKKIKKNGIPTFNSLDR